MKNPAHSVPKGARAAFTLIELLVVLAIIAILAGLLLPVLSRAKSAAHSLQCKANLRQLGLAVRQYLDAHQAYPPFLATDAAGDMFSGKGWYSLLDDFLHQGRSKRVAPGDFTVLTGVFQCPTHRVPKGDFTPSAGSYGYNAVGLWTTIWIPETPNGLGGLTPIVSLSGATPGRPTREAEVLAPSDMYAIGDGFESYRSGRIVLSDMLARDLSVFNERTDNGALAQKRHGGRLNVLFCDGHVDAPGIKSMFRDRTDATLRRWNADHEPHSERLQ